MEARSAAETRAQLAETLDALEAGQQPIAITRRGRTAAVLVPFERYQQLTARKAQLDGLLSRLGAWRAEFGGVDSPLEAARDASPGRDFEWPR